jgi:hypothetical protein
LPNVKARTGGTSRGADLQEVWIMHHWVLLPVWARTFEQEVGTDG